MTITYVVTSNGNDQFGDMALLSMISARLSNPNCNIHLICDDKTMTAATSIKHRMLRLCDHVQSVHAPDGPALFVNRWLKTQANQWAAENCLLLDSDTLVRGSLGDLPQIVEHLGAVANHNGKSIPSQIWKDDLAELQTMQWPTTFPFYANGGVLYFNRTDLVDRLFSLWHNLWLESCSKTFRLRDQPSLNVAITRSGVPIVRIPDSYNLQFQCECTGWSEAIVWHYFTSVSSAGTAYSKILSTVRSASLPELFEQIRAAITATHPYVTHDDIAGRIASRVNADGFLTIPELCWLKHGTNSERVAGAQDTHPIPAVHATIDGPTLRNSACTSLQQGLGQKMALLFSTEFDGLYKNGGIGTYYRRLARALREQAWYVVLINLGPETCTKLPGELDVDAILDLQEFDQDVESDNVTNLLLAECGDDFWRSTSLKCLSYVRACTNSFPGHLVYAEFHEMFGVGYDSAKASESGALGPNCIVGVTMHSGHEWIFESNRSAVSQGNKEFLNIASKEEQSFAAADLPMFPSDSLRKAVVTFGWRLDSAKKLPYLIPEI
jgi:hypothetical protein